DEGCYAILNQRHLGSETSPTTSLVRRLTYSLGINLLVSGVVALCSGGILWIFLSKLPLVSHGKLWAGIAVVEYVIGIMTVVLRVERWWLLVGGVFAVWVATEI